MVMYYGNNGKLIQTELSKKHFQSVMLLMFSGLSGITEDEITKDNLRFCY